MRRERWVRLSDGVSTPYACGYDHEKIVLSYPQLITIGQNHDIECRRGEILTLRQVAEFLKVTDRTIYRLAAAKKIPAFKVGGTWRFSKAEITEWIQQQTQGGKADKT